MPRIRITINKYSFAWFTLYIHLWGSVGCRKVWYKKGYSNEPGPLPQLEYPDRTVTVKRPPEFEWSE